MSKDQQDLESRVLVLAPMGKDAKLTCDVLSEAGLQCETCTEPDDLIPMLKSGVATLIITEEALTENLTTQLQDFLESQLSWSEIPIILTTMKDSLTDGVASVLPFTEKLRNVTVLERPIRLATFLSVVKTSLAERERQYKTRDLLEREKNAKLVAEHANRAKDEFLATLSHELRTPLNAVIGFSEILKTETPGSVDFEFALNAVIRNAKNQLDLINELLEVSRIIAGKFHLDKASTDMVELARNTLHTSDLVAKTKNISLKLVSKSPKVTLMGDPARLQQVISNLLSNALKFTSSGGQIAVEIRKFNSSVELSVKDTGSGIDPNFLPFIFEKFRQQDGSFNRRFGGLGLGLSITRHIVEGHGGTIKAESEGLGKGARFVVNFPYDAKDSALSKESIKSDNMSSIGPHFKSDGIHVLVVDDQPDSRRLIAAVLKKSGIEFVEAESAAKARLALSQYNFDAIICDIGMPDEDGLSFIHDLRKSNISGAKLLPAAALTGYASEEDKTKALEAGFSLHLTKPIRPNEILDAVQKLISMQKGSSDVVH